MFKFVMGMIFGAFISFIILVLLLVSNIDIDIALITNIVIAFATVTATAIHFDSISKQRRDRVWEINKGILLNLAHSLSDVIYATEYYIEEQYTLRQDPPEEPEGPKPSKTAYNDFRKHQEIVLKVYRPLMHKQLIESLEVAKKKNNHIAELVNYDAIDYLEAYDESLGAYQALQANLNEFMADISGVRNM
ncbi:hypothetical protein AB4343_16130 [Vibrio breoganii]|uniref:hypothetical protein n=1 Tax=Vibrio breoganii TaxID=553239 RepID=UPI000C83CAB2|nr:hypothetical protein [Vibrio breoganii]PMP10194.1 hypothetical protein BCS94_18255 [Vibrio breoganii]